jgi:hypothetical protein
MSIGLPSLSRLTSHLLENAMHLPAPARLLPPTVNRRTLLQAGFSGFLGISALTGRVGAADRRESRRGKSVILIFQTGGSSHLDTFDPKPDTPAEIRGEFRPIVTRVPGLLVSEHLPRLAARTDKYAVIRTFSHREYNHLVATHHVLTGAQQPGAFFDKIASRDDWPCYAAGLDQLRPRNDGVPSGVHLPTYLMQGPLTWPGQHAGFLGPRHDPWQINRDPASSDFHVDDLTLAPGLELDRLSDRRSLLAQVDRQQARLAESATAQRLTDQQALAFSVLTSGRVANAFELEREPAAVRDRYGRHAFGQSLLLARRLVQAGVSVVQANMGRAQTWDTHGDNFRQLKNRLLPPLDQGIAALLDDLDATGHLSETLVVLISEFGRTPKIGTQQNIAIPGRDHWAPCFCGLFAGAGVRGGQVIGRSDRIGAFPATTPYSPDDLGATVYDVLGVDPASEVRDRQGRPVRLNRGEVIAPLFTGAVS